MQGKERSISMRTIKVAFPGGKQADAYFEGFTVHTDQRLAHGGAQSGPNPFDLFFASMATCAGISALDYCHKHQLPTEGLAVTLHAHRHPVQPRYDRVVIEVTPPAGLTTKQIADILAEVDNCSVKQHILSPPSFELVCTPAPQQA